MAGDSIIREREREREAEGAWLCLMRVGPADYRQVVGEGEDCGVAWTGGNKDRTRGGSGAREEELEGLEEVSGSVCRAPIGVSEIPIGGVHFRGPSLSLPRP